MSKKRQKARKKKRQAKQHHIIGLVHPEHVATLIPSPITHVISEKPEEIAIKEPVVVAMPKTVWEKVKLWFTSSPV